MVYIHKKIRVVCNMLINRGEIFEKVIRSYSREMGASISAIAQKAGYDQSTIYRHFEKHDLDFHIIRKYGVAIQHDFSNEFPEMKELYAPEDRQDTYRTPTNLDECLQQIEYWRGKYIKLLERHNDMLSEKLT